MRKFIIVSSVCSVALMLAAGVASAQSQTNLAMGQERQGELTASDTASGDGGYRYDDYVLSLRAGQRIEATLTSEDFDAFLELYRRSDLSETIAADDDGAGSGTDSRLRLTVADTDDYILRVRPLGDETGSYTIALKERPAAPPVPRPLSIRKGAEIKGELSEGDAVNDEDDTPFDGYTFRARANERFSISVNADDFDPIVRVGQMRNNSFVQLDENDDGAGQGLNSYLVFTAPSTGDYAIRAGGLGSDARGDYTVSLQDGPSPLAMTDIAVGDTVEGRLDDSDGVNDASGHADGYRFTVTAGQAINAQLSSTDFDSYLTLRGPDGDSLAENDDSGGGDNGLDSRILHTFREAGTYSLEVTALGEEQTGDYVLSLQEAVPPPAPADLAFDEEVTGEIDADNPLDDEGRPFDAYRFSGEAGNRVQIVMRSGDFDAFLQVGKDEASFEALASDDDGLGEGTDSRLTYVIPETGIYAVRASPLGSEETGLYSIVLADRGPQPEPGSLLVGATARGTLSDMDSVTAEGALFDAYTVDVRSGQKLRVTLVSNDFDAFLEIGEQSDTDDFSASQSDDDSLSDTHARIDWDVEETGTYVIRARSFTSGQTGAYALTVETAN